MQVSGSLPGDPHRSTAGGLKAGGRQTRALRERVGEMRRRGGGYGMGLTCASGREGQRNGQKPEGTRKPRDSASIRSTGVLARKRKSPSEPT